MNATTIGSIKPATSAAQTNADGRRPDRAAGTDQVTVQATSEQNAFTRSLSAKQRELMQAREQSKGDEVLADQSPLQLLADKAASVAQAVPATRGMVLTDLASVTSERLALRGGSDPAAQPHPAAIRGGEPAQTWHASVSVPRGAPVQFTASYQPSAPSSQTIWTVSVVSPGTDAAALARQAGRLSDRLQDRLASRGTSVSVKVGRDESSTRFDPDESPGASKERHHD